MIQCPIWQYYRQTSGGYYKTTIKATSKRNHYFEFGLDIKPFKAYDFMNLELTLFTITKKYRQYLGVEFNGTTLLPLTLLKVL
jgi:hypothetical protein